MDLKSIITISGQISSGKSHIAELIQKEFNTPVASFGEYLRYYCEKNGLPVNRKSLQQVGETLVETNPLQFLIDVISHFIGAADRIILEGVRHKSIFEQVRHLTKNHVSIFVDADSRTRFNRYNRRSKFSDDTKTFNRFVTLDTHSVELEIESLKVMCGLVLDSTTDYADMLFEFLRSRQ